MRRDGLFEGMGSSNRMAVPILHVQLMVVTMARGGAETQADIRFLHSLPLQEIMARLNPALDSIAASN
jgi:hypothetical protein